MTGGKNMVYFVIVSVLLITVAPAHAYIDAGSGSYVLQMLIAGLLGLVFTIKLSWQRFKTFVGAKFSGKGPVEKRLSE
jgi:hypothetical protein